MTKGFIPGVMSPTGGPSGSLDQATFFEDWFTAGYIPDLALLNESDPSAKISVVADEGEWLATVTETTNGDATLVIADSGPFGVLSITNDGTDNDVVELQLNGEAFQPLSSRTIVFESRLAVGDVDASDWFVGLAATDTSVMANVADFIGFGNTANAADVYAVNGKNASGEPADAGAGTTRTDTTVDLADGTASTEMAVLRFELEGTSTIRFYVDGTLYATHTTNIPDDVYLTPTICIRNAAAASKALHVDYILATTTR